MFGYKQKLKNYIAYCEKDRREYSLEELNQMGVVELLALMPNNRGVNEYSETFGYHVTKNLVTFKMHKTIDSGWILEYSEGNRNKAIKERFILFELRCKNLQLGLIDIFLMVQNYDREYWNGLKSGHITIYLPDSWLEEDL